VLALCCSQYTVCTQLYTNGRELAAIARQQHSLAYATFKQCVVQHVRMVPWQAVAPSPTTSCVPVCAPCMCSWTLALGEWIIKRLPLVKHIYSASKQVRAWLQHKSGSTRSTPCILVG